MNTSSEIWVAFARTFSMLFLVLALLILVFYLVRKFSGFKGFKGGENYIRLVCVHHLSAKEKLVMVDVMGDILLLGVTPQSITKITSVDHPAGFPNNENKSGFFRFSDLLRRKLGNREENKSDSPLGKEK
ncbi:MAG: flagellar biosynthetic protein FliO [Desulfobacula sp. GWF2_41_7]|nr:MAG: flagellar biosynthetic protein FliO [Desulfobacula sp. GWF2_41_7]